MDSLIEKITKCRKKLADKNSCASSEEDLVFYRGQFSNCNLLPSLLRHSKTKREIVRIENKLFCDTFVICPQHIDSNNSWEILATMQHFGIPTRLLDWSSSLGSALFFAIEKCQVCTKKKKDCEECDKRPGLWMLAPHKMHEFFYPQELGSKVSFTVGVDYLPDYKSCFISKDKYAENDWKWKAPIFVDIPWRNLRIKSQKGSFTFHATSKALDQYPGHESFLLKIELSRKDIDDAKNLLKLLDITAFDMFSDLSSLSSYLKERYFPTTNDFHSIIKNKLH